MKEIASFPGYKVTREGRVYSIKHKKFIKEKPTIRNYPRVVLSKKGIEKSVFVHRLVAEAYCGLNPNNGHEVHHRDGNRWNYHAKNLQVLTPKQHRHLHKKGLVKRKCLTQKEAGTPF